eukprot:SAG22_NODE_20599_length_264_cov_0.854545_1_plen_29_part_10
MPRKNGWQADFSGGGGWSDPGLLRQEAHR